MVPSQYSWKCLKTPSITRETCNHVALQIAEAPVCKSQLSMKVMTTRDVGTRLNVVRNAKTGLPPNSNHLVTITAAETQTIRAMLGASLKTNQSDRLGTTVSENYNIY